MKLGLLRQMQFRFWRYAEPRAIFEWQSFYALRPILKRLPKGDGHPVIVFPGFGGSDRSTGPLRSLLTDLGYEAHGWGLGQNLTFDDTLQEEMVAHVQEVAASSGRSVTLVGWSLGGVYAREIAKVHPRAVRSVISLGSPISGNVNHSNAHSLFAAINGEPNKHDQARYTRLNDAPPVPTTSIYSKTDGIVAWEGSIQKSAPQTENIEVPASHLGIGVNPLVMLVIADRLAQPEGRWRPFRRKGLKSFIYGAPNSKFTRRPAQA